MPKLTSPEALSELRDNLLLDLASRPTRITISGGTCGEASGALSVVKAVRSQLEAAGLTGKVHVRVTGCQGYCQQEPLVIVEPLDALYCRVTADDVAEIVSESLVGGRVVKRLCYVDDRSGQTTTSAAELPFFAKQDRELIGRNRFIDPCNISDYIAAGGYSALVQVLTSMQPEAVIKEIELSGLRGRGGGGYPTSRKWTQCRQAPGDTRYVICNADEGDPGAYMDRGLLEGNPHSIIEGMLIGAYAVGATKGYVYVRNEYPLAVANTRLAIQQAQELGLLGDDILGTGFSFDVKVARGGGAFICGESTALMASLEGQVGEPRPKDVHTVERGYLDQPTLLNNVETWANVPGIMLKGSAWFAAKGTEKSKGTKIFSLTGHVKNTGLVEVEMGTSLREIVFDIGGGQQNGKAIKAVQTGGPSGGCLPASLFDLPVDYEALSSAGSMMGSGGMVVMDSSACMVDVAKYFLKFLQEESCGKCIPAAWAPTACSRSSPTSLRAAAAWSSSTPSKTWPGPCRSARSAPSARPRPTRCSRPCATSPTSTRRTSKSSVARQASAPRCSRSTSTPTSAPCADRAPRPARTEPSARTTPTASCPSSASGAAYA